jgi:hypothetical protein
MKFSIGDIVLLKQTGEEGRVVQYISEDMVEVEVKGTHFPVFIDEVEHPYLYWFTQKKPQTAKPIRIEQLPVENKYAQQNHNLPPGFHLSFMPVYKFDAFEDVIERMKIYFINQTPQTWVVQYECSVPANSIFSHKISIPPYGHFYLHDLDFEYMHLQPRFSWWVQHDHYAESRMADTLRIKPKKLFDYLSLLQQNNEPMFNVALTDKIPDLIFANEKNTIKPDASIDLGPLKSKSTNANSKSKPHRNKALASIDLHIEQLVSNYTNLSNFEMLTIQLQALEQAIDNALAHHQQSLIVIHGVGTGKLKEEVHQRLSSYSGIAFFQHHWSPRYGYGATEVFFK